MKTDMSGGAAVIGGDVGACATLGVKTHVTGYVPMVENMPSGNAIRPGDVLKIRNGKTVEVLNTDAEGRLILADALSLASEEKPAAVIDLATLTGACMVALGEKIAGLMGNDDDWSDAGARRRRPRRRAGVAAPAAHRVPQAARVGGRRHEEHRPASYGGALTAGLFLQEFVDGVPVGAPRHRRARVPREPTTATSPKGGTGFGVRTLVELRRAASSRPRSDRVASRGSKRSLATALGAAAGSRRVGALACVVAHRVVDAGGRGGSATVHEDGRHRPHPGQHLHARGPRHRGGHDRPLGQRRPEQPQRHARRGATTSAATT